MSDNKNYYYLKLKENFFESEEIKLLESIENGYLYSNILLKMYLKSLKNEGRLMFRENIPYNSKMLATITGHNLDVVEKAVKIFIEFGLIQVLDSGAIYIMDIQNFIGASSDEADRVRAYRNKITVENKQVKYICTNVQQMNDESTPEIEKELELNKNKNICSSPDERLLHFESFWKNYPRRQNKQAAVKAWKAHNCNQHIEEILDDIDFRKKNQQPNGWLNSKNNAIIDVNYIPLPSSYLNGERWQDEIVEGL